MKAMRFAGPNRPLLADQCRVPEPGRGEVLVKVRACGVCRTDLHLVDGELPEPKPRVIPGHEIVGIVERAGAAAPLAVGMRVGVPWLGFSCGECAFCRRGEENLCDRARFTGYTLDGGYADYAVADARYAFPLPSSYGDAEAAPLLCAGLIGYRSLRKTGDPERLGIYGFGAAAHIVAQIAVYEGREVYAFTRPGDHKAQAFALSLGASWAGSSLELPPAALDAAIIFAPVGALVPAALKAVRKGGIVVCGGIHMSDVPSFPYDILWGERTVTSVANLTRADAVDFVALAPKVPVRTHIETYALECANEALDDLRHGRLQGAAVLIPKAGR